MIRSTFVSWLCTIYRRFIPDFTGITQPLNKLLRKNAPETVKRGEEQLTSFKTFIEKICSPPVRALPRPNLAYSVDIDVSAYGVGWNMFQTYEDGTRKRIGYWSRSLNDAECSYSASERECLSVLSVLQTVRPYIQ